jgi:MFS family permease
MSIIDLGVLKERNSLLLFFSQSISAICDKMMSIGLVWYLTKHISIEIIPWFLAISFLPHLIFSFFSTSLIHRYTALKVVIYSEFFRGFVLLLFYFLLSFTTLSIHQFIFSLFLTMFLVGAGSSLFNPAILTLPPQITRNENIMKLNALIDSSLSLSTILGAVFAVFLLQYFALKDVVLINAISFLWAGVLQLGVRPLVEKSTETISDKPYGLILVIKKFPSIARMLFLFFLMNLFLNPIFVFIPWYVDKVYLGDSSVLALIEGAMGVGAFLTGVFVSLLQLNVKDSARAKMITMISFLFGVFFVLFSYSRFTWQGASIIFLVGALSTFLNIQVLTYFQTAVDQAYVPSIMTAVNLISTASLPLSFIVTGVVLPNIDGHIFVKATGILVILLSFTSISFLKDINEN